jgi:hypothetical protein
MFGKPHWFRPKTIVFGLVPVTWQAWIYTVAWCLAIAIPFLLLLTRYQPIEALIWMTLGLALLVYDVRQILHARCQPATACATKEARRAPQEDTVLYILDDHPPERAVATRGFNLQMKH